MFVRKRLGLNARNMTTSGLLAFSKSLAARWMIRLQILDRRHWRLTLRQQPTARSPRLALARRSPDGSFRSAVPREPWRRPSRPTTCRSVPIRSYNESYLSIHTPEVLAKIRPGDIAWESMVPAVVVEMIKAKHLFGWQTEGAPSLK